MGGSDPAVKIWRWEHIIKAASHKSGYNERNLTDIANIEKHGDITRVGATNEMEGL